MGKIIEIRELYNERIDYITKSEDNWISFLKTASWNFKYSFNDQILIYAQRPDATACADMSTWNNKVHRWIKKGADYIFVFSKNENSKYPFKLVFDVADTHNYRNTPYKLWGVKPEYEKYIIESLEVKFGDVKENSNLANAIIDIANNIVIDNIQDYMSSIVKYKQGNMLENLSNEEINQLLYQTVFSSVAYMMLNRSEINPENYIAKSEFSYINIFNNSNLTILIGTAISDIAEIGLREIAKTVINLQKVEKNQNHTFVNNEKEEYSNNKENIKGGNDYDRNRIQENGRLQYAQSNNETRKTTNRQIRTNEIKLSKEEQERGIHDTINGQQTSRTSERSTGNGNEDDKSNSRENGETGWNNRRIENERPNDLDENDEQLQDDSRGTSNDRTNLQLEILTEKEQKQNIAEAENASVFSFTQEMIDNVLQEGSQFAEGKFRIYEQFNKSLSSQENVDFLKKEYGTGGRSADHNGISEEHSPKGIVLSSKNGENKQILRLTWLQVEKRIKELISIDRYLSEIEKDEYYDWLDSNDRPQINNEIENQIKDENYEYNVGDIVYIGTKEYSIIEIEKDRVLVTDTKFPILVEEFDRKEFDKKVKENPANDKLRNKKIIQELKTTKEKYIKQDEKKAVENKQNETIEITLKPIIQYKLIYNVKKKRKNKIEYFDLHPEIPLKDRNNYKITDNTLGEGTKKEKYKRNIEAIKLLMQCEQENRYATIEEQEILSQYVGWGGIPEAFDKNNDDWSKEYTELSSLLTEKEYKEAKQSTLTSFYTPPIVINSIYKALVNMGLSQGNILEPSCRNW